MPEDSSRTDGDSIAHVAVVILLLVLAIPALATAYQYAGTPFSYEETLTIDFNSTSNVSQSATFEGYSEGPKITAFQQPAKGGTVLVEDTDYAWNSSTGTVTWFDTPNTSDGQEARIEYEAYQRTEVTEVAWMVIAPLMGLFGLYAILVSVRALWALTAELWDL
jgi:hypothetical protein